MRLVIKNNFMIVSYFVETEINNGRTDFVLCCTNLELIKKTRQKI